MFDLKKGLFDVIVLMAIAIGLVGAGFVLGHFTNSVFHESVAILITDYSKCSEGSYTVVLSEKSINYSGKQTEKNHTAGSVPDDVVSFLVRADGKVDDAGLIDYQIKAEYSDCETIISDRRRVKPKQVIYESINDNMQISHLIRS